MSSVICYICAELPVSRVYRLGKGFIEVYRPFFVIGVEGALWGLSLQGRVSDVWAVCRLQGWG